MKHDRQPSAYGRSVLLLALLRVAAGCTSPVPAPTGAVASASTIAVVPPPIPDDARVTLERFPCDGEGYCAAYAVTIARDGEVSYEGRKYVRVRGRQVRRVDPGAARALFEHFIAASFEAWKPRYVGAADAAIATVQVTMGGRTTKVIDAIPCNLPRHDRVGLPALCDLEQEVETLAGTRDWVKCTTHDGLYCSDPPDGSP